jgi:DNA invertase Pin-like site-specific DNA recombinase
VTTTQKPALEPENKPHKIARGVVHRRVSTDDQAEHGSGLDAQLHACQAYCDRQDLEMLGPFDDEGIGGSASLDKRLGLAEAIANVMPGDILLVAKRDRIGRDPILVAMIEIEIKKRGGKVVSAAGEGTEDDSPSSILMRRVIDAFAEFERLMIKARTCSAIASLRRRGRVCGTVPYGRRAVDDGQHSKTSIKANAPRPSAIADDPAELATIALIRELHGRGNSPRVIGLILDQRGIPTKRGGPWAHQSIRKILKREAAR